MHYVSPKTRAKMSEAKKRNWQDPEYRNKRSNNLGMRVKMSEAKKLHWQNPEYREKISEARREQWQDPGRRVKLRELMLQYWEIPEFRDRVIKAGALGRMLFWQDPENRKAYSERARQRERDPIAMVKMREGLKQAWQDPEYRARMSRVRKRRWQNPNYRNKVIAKMRRAAKRRWQDPAYIAKKSNLMKQLWQDPGFVSRQMMSRGCKPNKLEIQFGDFLDAHFPGEWKYVGDGQLIIGGKCPDFANVDGKKELIELYGDYWHRDDNPQDRIDHFAQYGYNCLIFWESDINKSREGTLLEIIKARLDKCPLPDI